MLLTARALVAAVCLISLSDLILYAFHLHRVFFVLSYLVLVFRQVVFSRDAQLSSIMSIMSFMLEF